VGELPSISDASTDHLSCAGSVNETPRWRRSWLDDEPASSLQLAGELL
jgi:hypothetical protein